MIMKKLSKTKRIKKLMKPKRNKFKTKRNILKSRPTCKNPSDIAAIELQLIKLTDQKVTVVIAAHELSSPQIKSDKRFSEKKFNGTLRKTPGGSGFFWKCQFNPLTQDRQLSNDASLLLDHSEKSAQDFLFGQFDTEHDSNNETYEFEFRITDIIRIEQNFIFCYHISIEIKEIPFPSRKKKLRTNPSKFKNTKKNPDQVDQLINLIGKRVCIRGDGDDKFGILEHWWSPPSYKWRNKENLKSLIERENKRDYSSASKRNYTIMGDFENIIYQFSYIFIKKIEGRIIWMNPSIISKFNEIFKEQYC